MRYSLIGTGYFGAELGRLLASVDGASITTVYDPENAEAVAAELNAEVYPTAEAAIDRDDVDAVIVASPNWIHHEAVFAAAAAGKHIFCEKPISLDHATCQAMVEAAADAGVHFMAGHVMWFFDGVRQAKQWIADGVVGRILYAHAARTGWQDAQPTVSWKKRRETSGGHLYHHIHELDFIQSILGSPHTATMVGGNYVHQGEGLADEDDLLTITLEFDGAVALLEYGSAFRWPEHYVLLQGTEGAIKLDMSDAGVTLSTPDGITTHLLHRTQEEDDQRTAIYAAAHGGVMYGNPDQRPPLWLQTIMLDELVYFDALIRGAEPTAEFAALTDGTAATASIATADACTLSLRENRKVALSEVTG